MKRCFVFCHGFGLTTNFWNPLRPYFANEQCIYLELGYFDQQIIQLPTIDASYTLIGIGHSLGLIKLLLSQLPFHKLIGLHAFINFQGFDLDLHKRRESELTAFKRSFHQQTTVCLASFYKRCGILDFNFDFRNLNCIRLRDDLEYLSSDTKLPEAAPLLSIHAKDDLIVPPELAHDNFADRANVTILMCERGQHSLHNMEPQILFQTIMGFVNAF